MPRRRWTPCDDRLPARREGRDRHFAAHAPPPDDDRIDAARAKRRVQGAARRRNPPHLVAAPRRGRLETRDGPKLPALRSRRRPCPDAGGRACREDRADGGVTETTDCGPEADAESPLLPVRSNGFTATANIRPPREGRPFHFRLEKPGHGQCQPDPVDAACDIKDRKSTRLNSSH